MIFVVSDSYCVGIINLLGMRWWLVAFFASIPFQQALNQDEKVKKNLYYVAVGIVCIFSTHSHDDQDDDVSYGENE